MTVRFSCTPALRGYMEKKGLDTLVVEVVSSSSDFEITELYIHLIRPRQAEDFRRRRYRSAPLEDGPGMVLLPPYRLEYDDSVVFDLRKFWVFHGIRAAGVRL